ncbi:YigZ family protein [Peribacillus asahii]|uniref:YigZ family protein n=1 Tax=Peribacillus asahii TaxID=228899 RepID=A0A398B5Q7_9BACI|nr:YigZ family protein [Peribacillus asahii]RID84774.1 YigZ family protein [Peribacillus asahii]
MLPYYLTVQHRGEHEIVIEKSRFIAHVARTETEEEAQTFIAEIKKKHKDATHNCSAYLIGERDEIQKALDDGEPSGTAGVPILEVLKKKNLKDTTVVVTRYFGGIKLGAGGLIRAYSKSTSEGIEATGIVERKLMRVISTKVDYTWLGKLENELRASIYTIKEIEYLDQVIIHIFAEEEKKQDYIDWMTELTNGQAIIQEGDILYLEQKISKS